METNKVYLGDCLELIPKLKPQSIDFIFADIPYNSTACKWDKDILPLNRHIMVQKGKKQIPIYLDQYLLDCYEQGIPREQAIETFENEAKDGLWDCFKRVLKPNGVVAMTASQPFTTKLAMSNQKWLKYEWIWNKVSGANFANTKHGYPLKTQESVLIFAKGSCFTFNPQRIPRTKASLKRFPKGKTAIITPAKKRHANHFSDGIQAIGSTLSPDGLKHPVDIIKISIKDVHHEPAYGNPYKHPTKKPIKLLLYLIKTYTNEGALVLDPTAGSGTTGVAAIELKRNFILIEKDPEYYTKIEKRLEHTKERVFLFNKYGVMEEKKLKKAIKLEKDERLF